MGTPQKIVEGLYMVAGAVNVFLLDDPDAGLILIDTGMPRFTKRILAAVNALGKQPADLKHILITHADIDHIGSLAALAQATKARVYAGAESAQYIVDRQQPPHVPFFIAMPSNLLLRFIQAGKVDQIIQDGEVLPLVGGIRVFKAAGHTPDNLVFFWEREKVLFAPDLLNTMSGDLALSPAMITWDMSQTKANARKMLELEPAYICVGHGNFVKVAQAPEQLEKLSRQLI